MKTFKRQAFNLIEILIALGVLSIGMVAVLGLFPVGFSTTRDAMAESSSADAADQMLHMLQFRLKDPTLYNADGTVDATGTTGKTCWYYLVEANGIPDAKPSTLDFTLPPWNPSVTTDTVIWKQIEPFTAGCAVKQVLNATPPVTYVPGLYKIIRFSDFDSTDVIPAAGGKAAGEPYYNSSTDTLDFEAIAVNWKEKVNVDGTASGELPYNKAVVLNIEISWPANQLYAKRKKALYRLELFNN